MASKIFANKRKANTMYCHIDMESGSVFEPDNMSELFVDPTSTMQVFQHTGGSFDTGPSNGDTLSWDIPQLADDVLCGPAVGDSLSKVVNAACTKRSQ